MMRFLAGVALCASLFATGQLAYEWSFTDTDFGGYIGVILPLFLNVLAFVAGLLARKD